MPPRDRHDWTREEVAALWARPLLDLVFDAATVHRARWPRKDVQRATLLSVKTGGCAEDCGYCPQASRYATGVERQALLPLDAVKAAATQAKAEGASRFCMGGAWRDVPDGPAFDRLLEMVKAVRALGLEACLTAGMLRRDQADRLAEAGLSAYNHNLDTGEAYYDRVITTRTYADRLATLDHVRDAGIPVCCGGILGLGEAEGDRIDLLHRLATFTPHPESVPINLLVPVEGTPMAGRPKVDPFDLVRAVAVARILMPSARIRLSAGRRDLSDGDHALCFLAGANSIFAGDRLLTTPNVDGDRDDALLARLGLASAPPPAPEAGACAGRADAATAAPATP
ncbi:MAG: biotin synthase BioB [Planctomycetota bacterium]